MKQFKYNLNRDYLFINASSENNQINTMHPTKLYRISNLGVLYPSHAPFAYKAIVKYGKSLVFRKVKANFKYE